MKKVLIFVLTLFAVHSTYAQVFTYTTRVGAYNGPVKSVLSTSDMGVTVDYYAPDGRIEKSLNSAKDEYTIFSWDKETISQKFYDNSTDEFKGESFIGYVSKEDCFMCITSQVCYYWDFNDSMLFNLSHNGKNVIWCMATENKTPQGYNSVVYVKEKPTSKTEVKTYDPDEHGNFTRFVTITPDGVEHERIVTYEYY